MIITSTGGTKNGRGILAAESKTLNQSLPLFNEAHFIKLIFTLAYTQAWLDELCHETCNSIPVLGKRKFRSGTYYLSVSALAHILERHYCKIPPSRCRKVPHRINRNTPFHQRSAAHAHYSHTRENNISTHPANQLPNRFRSQWSSRYTHHNHHQRRRQHYYAFPGLPAC